MSLMISLALLTGCRAEKKIEPSREIVRYVEARSASDLHQKSGAAYIGIVRGDVEMDLSFKVNGILDLIGPPGKQDWEEGITVKKGQVLAQLKQADFSNAVAIARAHADLDQKQFERNRKLLDTGAVSKQEFDVFAANKSSSKAALAQAEQALLDSTLVSPIDGTILARFANAGETVPAGKIVLRIANLRVMSVELGVPDKLVHYFKVGDRNVPATISALEGYPPFMGEISEVGVAAKNEARLFRIVIKLPNPDGKIKSGMTASVPVGDLRIAPGVKAVTVPVSALVSRKEAATQNELAVYVVEEGGTVREQAVQTGDFVGSSIVVTRGLKAGDKVVVVGASILYPGARVEAREATPWQRF